MLIFAHNILLIMNKIQALKKRRVAWVVREERGQKRRELRTFISWLKLFRYINIIYWDELWLFRLFWYENLTLLILLKLFKEPLWINFSKFWYFSNPILILSSAFFNLNQLPIKLHSFETIGSSYLKLKNIKIL